MATGLAASATACDTPVYRYAMYRWEPSPYEVYHFHHGQMGEEFAAVKDALASARNEKISPANVAVYPVNLDEDKELKTVPRDVRRLWQTKVEAGVKTPATLIVNPQGTEVFSGALNKTNIDALVNSPTRQEVGKLLSKGHAGVFVLVLGKDEELNKTASAALDKLIADVNSGKLSLYSGPDAYDPLNTKLPDEKEDSRLKPSDEGRGEKEPADVEAEDRSEAPDDEQPPHSATALKFSREALEKKDPWLLRNLMAVEGDLAEYTDEPMLFVVYGRGRALPPYIGKGIVYDNLVQVTDFITSACSCTVKDQNPGVDLLMTFDWESASAKVAKRFGSEEGNNETLDDLFPQLIVPGGSDIEKPKDE